MNDSLRIIAGLGNPGPRYRANRHNVGFMVVEELAERLGLGWTPWGDWAVASGTAAGQSSGGMVALVKPLAYMNRSGEALAAWARNAGLTLTGAPTPAPVPDPAADPSGDPEADPESDPAPGTTPAAPEGIRPLVVCDDLNLPLGSVRLRNRGRSGGQNGLASVIEVLGGGEFPRMRLGVAPLGVVVPPEAWADFVLEDFDPGEKEAVADLVDHAATALEFLLEHGLEATGSRFNRRIRPESPTGE